MSGKMFKPGSKLGKEGLKKGANYKAGSLTFDPKMAKELVDVFLRENTIDSVELFGSHFNEEFLPQLRTYPNLDADGFIDAVIRQLEEAEPFHAEYTGFVLNPVLSLMYELGYDNPILNLKGIFTKQHYIIADIAATEEKPFSIVLRLAENPTGLDACYAAYSLKHCTVRLFGSAETVGDHGFHSDYTLEDKVRQVGYFASNCVFRFPHVKAAVCTNQRSPVYAGRHRFKMARGGKVFHMSVENSFFRDNNKLLIPDGKGSWKEVLPE